MNGKKNMGRASSLLLVLLALGFSFATYNLLTMVFHYRNGSADRSGSDPDWNDPVTTILATEEGLGRSNAKYHVVLTATDAPYSKWQRRIMYYWYKKMKVAPGSDMRGFTRVLHSGQPDNLMDEIPTSVVDPLPSADRSGSDPDWNDPVTTISATGEGLGRSNAKYHVVLTATDTPHSKWQCRIMYYWYKKMKVAPGSDMGGFTRVLHSGQPDNLMDEIPTSVVDPLPEGIDRGYIVLNRPWAFVQWLEKAVIEEEYILMAEPDHIFVNPLPNLAHGDNPSAFPFSYITPSKHEKIIRKYYPEDKGPVTNVDPIRNSPVIIKKAILEQIAPTWMNVSLRMKDDQETEKAFGWVLEMYAYAVASALHDVRHILRKDFMIQPPWDLEVGKSFIIHYKYGCDYTMQGILTYGRLGEWRFDKRSYLQGPPPKNLPLPPPGVPESVVRLVKMVNEATANIAGWDAE